MTDLKQCSNRYSCSGFHLILERVRVGDGAKERGVFGVSGDRI